MGRLSIDYRRSSAVRRQTIEEYRPIVDEYTHRPGSIDDGVTPSVALSADVGRSTLSCRRHFRR